MSTVAGRTRVRRTHGIADAESSSPLVVASEATSTDAKPAGKAAASARKPLERTTRPTPAVHGEDGDDEEDEEDVASAAKLANERAVAGPEEEDPLPSDMDQISDVDPDLSLHTILTVLPDDHEESESIPAMVLSQSVPITITAGRENSVDTVAYSLRSDHGADAEDFDDLDGSLPVPGTLALSRSPSHVLDNNGYRDAVARLRAFTATLDAADKAQLSPRSPGLRAAAAGWRRRTMSLSAIAESLAAAKVSVRPSPLSEQHSLQEEATTPTLTSEASLASPIVHDDALSAPVRRDSSDSAGLLLEKVDPAVGEVEPEVAMVTQASKKTSQRRASVASSVRSTTMSRRNSTATTPASSRPASTEPMRTASAGNVPAAGRARNKSNASITGTAANTATKATRAAAHDASGTARRAGVTGDRKRPGLAIATASTGAAATTTAATKGTAERRMRASSATAASTAGTLRRTGSQRSLSTAASATSPATAGRAATAMGNYAMSSRTTATSRSAVASRARATSSPMGRTGSAARTAASASHSRASSSASTASIPTPTLATTGGGTRVRGTASKASTSAGTAQSQATSLPGSPLPTDVYPIDGTLDLAMMEGAFTDVDDDACCCGHPDCPRWLTWCAGMAARDEDLRLAAEIGQTLLEKHEQYVEQSRQSIQELRERCRQDDRRYAVLQRDRDHWRRMVEDVGRERDAIVEERTNLEQTIEHLRRENGRIRSELTRTQTAVGDSDELNASVTLLRNELAQAQTAQRSGEARVRRWKARH
ncbi:hypothetical protein THASP1DRAFT_32101, partial [Thamnocephalis sphaerospora]